MKEKYIAFLRGINVGGHHKIPMTELRTEMEKLGFENVITILNSGNVIFETAKSDTESLESTISKHLEKSFGFPVPTIVRSSAMIHELLDENPFKNIKVTKDIRLYVSFLRENIETGLKLPWASADSSYKIISKNNKTILSILDLSVSKTIKAMETLEKYFGKDITTRNLNTLERIEKQLNGGC